MPLASPKGQEFWPRFSPDGETVAFSGNYDGNVDIYAIPVNGGIPRRLTYHPGMEEMSDFTPDGKVAFIARRSFHHPWAQSMFVVDPDGGPSEELPLPYVAYGTFSPDGEWVAYGPWTRQGRTWKRYQGGRNENIWLFNLKSLESEELIEGPGTEALPMWREDKIYFISDSGPYNRLNIWVYDVDSGSKRQVTSFKRFDVKWPSIGPREIVFENGGKLHLLDLATEKTREVKVHIPGDHPGIRPRMHDVSRDLHGASISPTGKRVGLQMRGDIWTAPAEHGLPRNLTRTDGVAERGPSWSPDGKWVAYFSDRSGEYELTLIQSDGKGEEEQLTKGSDRYLMNIGWSPDSKMLTYQDKTGALYLYDIDSGKSKFIDRHAWARDVWTDWSQDSSWMAVCIPDEDNGLSVIKLYDVKDGKLHTVTSPFFNTAYPAFDRNGDWLYATVRNELSPIYGDYDHHATWIYANSTRVIAYPLRDDVKSPFLPESDEEEFAADEEEEAEDTDEDADADEDAEEEEPEDEGLKIDLDGFEARGILLPMEAGNYGYPQGGENKFFISRWPRAGSKGEGQILQYDMGEKKETSVLQGAGEFGLTADGKKMLVFKGKQLFITKAGPGAKLDKPIRTKGMLAHINPRSEWKMVVMDAWRIYRDYFYDPGMHGVDWEAVGKRYVAMVEHATCRDDVSYIIGEMIAELNVGHAYYWTWPEDMGPSVSVGMLGCDYELVTDARGNQAYRISRIVRGGDWDSDAVGPLSQPGIDVNEGDYLLAVNGIPVSTDAEPWAALQNLAGKTVTLSVSSQPMLDDEAREVLVTPLSSDIQLRYRDWVERKRAYVYEKTGGKVGYIYLPNTGIQGQNELMRAFIPQFTMDGLIIDERWNGGGQIPTRFIELLNRPVENYFWRHEGKPYRYPTVTHAGPKVMLINQDAGSGGDMLPYLFRQQKLGKLVGTRTWGGLVGLSGNPMLIDGSYATVPNIAFYEVDGTWGIEGYGVDPDIEVPINPTLEAKGIDHQLDKAIEVILDELRTKPWVDIDHPPFPDRSGSGIEKEDR